MSKIVIEIVEKRLQRLRSERSKAVRHLDSVTHEAMQIQKHQKECQMVVDEFDREISEIDDWLKNV